MRHADFYGTEFKSRLSLYGSHERKIARALADPAKLDEISRNVRAFTLAHKERGIVGEMVVEETLREWGEREARP